MLPVPYGKYSTELGRLELGPKVLCALKLILQVLIQGIVLGTLLSLYGRRSVVASMRHAES